MPTKTGPTRKRRGADDPRRDSRATGNQNQNHKVRRDPVTIVLAVVAVLLLVVVALLFDRRITDALFGSASSRFASLGNQPDIERVAPENEALPRVPDQEVDLGAPEQGVPETPVLPETIPDAPVEDPPREGSTQARLFFVKVSAEGQISLKSVLRTVPATGSPLTVAVNSLLDGPRPGELSNSFLSLVPEGSLLLGARVSEGIAYLDFSEDFRFNALGIEGYQAQVEQLVFTATEFPTVNAVQILIEGQRVDYLGGEGFWVGSPLSRNDF